MNTDDKKFELDKLVFEKSLQQRNFEIDNFWKRGWFFGAFLLAIASGYFGVLKEDSTSNYGIYLSFLGFLISLFQSLMNRGSKYWQERWENKTKNKESILGIDLTKTQLYDEQEKDFLNAATLAKNENRFTVASRFSVSKLTILSWDIITISFGCLWINDLLNIFGVRIDYPRVSLIIFHAIIITYILLFVFLKKRLGKNDFFARDGGKVYEPFINEWLQNRREPYFTISENYIKNDQSINNNESNTDEQ